MSDSDSQGPFDAEPGAGDFPGTGAPDRVTEVTSKSWFGRIRDSFVGALIGLLLVVGAVVLLTWNERNEVFTLRALSFGAGNVVEAVAGLVDPTQNGKLVHLTGPLAASPPAHDPVFGAVAPDAVRLRRHVEMFQWKETSSSTTQKSVGGASTTTTTYEYQKVWSETPIDSNHFHAPNGHANPAMSVRSTVTDDPDARLGTRQMAPAVQARLTDFMPVTPAEGVALPPGWRLVDGTVYHGYDPAQPAIGDLRVQFAAIPAGGTVSVVAGQQGERLEPFAAPNGRTIALARTGIADAPAMFGAERSATRHLAWILRGVGFVLCLAGLVLMVRPLAVLVSVLPFLESVVDVAAFIVMLGAAAFVTLVTIAIARIVVQPLLSAGLIVAGIVIVVGAARLRGRPARPAVR
jgi:hypothetical protein